jgi:predicted aspartyl protease
MSEKGNLGPSEQLVYDWWVYKQQRCRGLAMSIFLLDSRMSYKKFFIDVKINGYSQRMKVDSGCHDTIINKGVWRDVGEPELVIVKTTRRSALGKDIPLKGKLFAQVEIAGKTYVLPILVSDDDSTRSLIGRRWIPEWNCINWNKLFNDETLVLRSSVPNNRRVRANAMKYRSIPIILDVILQGIQVEMILDTGATAFIIGLGTWVSIGKPQLNQTKRTMSDTSNSSLDLKGEFTAQVKYNGRPFQLILLVSNKFQIKNIIGTNWFTSMDFDFNAVFDNIQFPAPTTTVIEVSPKVKAFEAITFDSDTSSSALLPKVTGDIQKTDDDLPRLNKKRKLTNQTPTSGIQRVKTFTSNHKTLQTPLSTRVCDKILQRRARS